MRNVSVAEGVLGVTNFANPERALSEALITLNGHDNSNLPVFDPSAAGDRDPMSKLAAAAEDAVQRIICVTDVNDFIRTAKMRSTNTLMDWAQYSYLMQEYGTKRDGSATALMIGSMNALSSRSFVYFAQEEYGADTAIVVDPVGGKDKVRHGHFVYGDGLALPFKDESMDFIHTNQLIHMLDDRSSLTSFFDLPSSEIGGRNQQGACARRPSAHERGYT